MSTLTLRSVKDADNIPIVSVIPEGLVGPCLPILFWYDTDKDAFLQHFPPSLIQMDYDLNLIHPSQCIICLVLDFTFLEVTSSVLSNFRILSKAIVT